MSIFEDITAIQNIIYIVASILFISGIKMLGKEDTAVKGNFLSAFAMFIAVLATIIFIVDPDYITWWYFTWRYYWFNNSLKSEDDFYT